MFRLFCSLSSLSCFVQPLLFAVQPLLLADPQLAVHCTASPAFRQTSLDVVQLLPTLCLFRWSVFFADNYSCSVLWGSPFFCFISHPVFLILMIYWTYDLLAFRFVGSIWVSLHKTSKKHLSWMTVIIFSLQFLFIRGSEHSAPSSECIYIFC